MSILCDKIYLDVTLHLINTLKLLIKKIRQAHKILYRHTPRYYIAANIVGDLIKNKKKKKANLSHLASECVYDASRFQIM